ncbi:MAG: RNA methyltransferase [Cyclobacteriaceae bacterium]
MITNKDAKFIKSLQLKKYREREKSFVVEGGKNVIELLGSSLKIRRLFVTQRFLEENGQKMAEGNTRFEIVTEKDLVKAGSFQTNAFALAVVQIPELPVLKIENRHVLAFENLQDPGNLGTIIRLADWYGFSHIVCSPDSVDAYNPKVISASMGSFARIRVYYENLPDFINQSDLPVYGAVLSGESIHETSFEDKGILLFGNESQGISSGLVPFITNPVKIPGFGKAESLNVAIATAVFCDNLRRVFPISP